MTQYTDHDRKRIGLAFGHRHAAQRQRDGEENARASYIDALRRRCGEHLERHAGEERHNHHRQADNVHQSGGTLLSAV